jgi:predicted CXXCH cytochrome family protein
MIESVFATYLRTGASGTLRAVSQSELLSQSQCAKQSAGRLWCGTCHNPHGGEQNRTQSIRQVCLSCHADLFAAGRHRAADECVSCHMPRLRPTNVAHSAVTDHSIPRRPRPEPSEVNAETGAGDAELKAWREPEPALIQRDLGLAYFDLAANQQGVSSLESVSEAYRILSRLPAQQRQDAAVQADLASVLLQQNEQRLAIRLFERAAAEEPSNARYAYCLGVALDRAGKSGEAVQALRHSIELDPSQPGPYLELAQIYKKMGQEEQSRGAVREYLQFMPQNIQMRSGLR